jgi:3-hydroxyacyl-[acyl-carrier-protein] dehydratase
VSSDSGGAAIGPLDIRRVMAALPHRYPMLLVDRVEELVPDKSIAPSRR